MTKATKLTPASYIKTLEGKSQKEARVLLKTFKEVTGSKPVMWGSMIGFGSYHYKYPTGREGDSFASGFATRKSGPTIYIMPGYQNYSALLKKIGPHKLGKCCLYFKNLDDVDLVLLSKLIKAGVRDLNKIYPVKK